MRLSKRMHCLASLVTEGSRLADVGTDHGYVPIYLVENRRIPSAIAMDINRGPLARAEEHIKRAGLSTYIETRLSDGLAGLRPGEADSILIAGMGGMLVIRILEEGMHCLYTEKELILQPQSDIPAVRRWLYEHQYRIVTEDILQEDWKYYPMMKAVHGQERKPEPEELYCGKWTVQRSPAVLSGYLQAKLAENQKIMQTLQQSGNGDTKRAEEVEKAMDIINRILEDRKEDFK